MAATALGLRFKVSIDGQDFGNWQKCDGLTLEYDIYDYKEGGCRQVKDCEVSANLGWANPGTGSAMVMRRD